MTQQERQLIGRLRGIRRRVRLLLAAYGLGLMVAVVCAAFLAPVLADYLLRFPGAIRLLITLGLVGVLGYSAWRFLWLPMRVRISLDDVALKLEARFPDLNDKLASAVNFITHPDGQGDVSAALVREVIRESGTAASGVRLSRALSARATSVAALLGVVGAGLLFLSVSVWPGPQWVRTGLGRMFWPLADSQWPRRIEIDPVSRDAQLPVGDTFTVSMRLARGQGLEPRAYVYYKADSETVYRRQKLDRVQTTRTTDLPADPDNVAETVVEEIDAPAGKVKRSVHVLKRPEVRYVIDAPFKNLQESFNYYFAVVEGTLYLTDREVVGKADGGRDFRVEVVRRPMVASATYQTLDPEYLRSPASRPEGGERWRPPAPIVGSTIKVLAGARLRLLLAASKAELDSLVLTDGKETWAGELIDPSANLYSVELPRAVDADLAVIARLVDKYGFDNNYGGCTWDCRIRVYPDGPPNVAISEPDRNVVEVTEDAEVAVRVQAWDDFGVSRIEMLVDRGPDLTASPGIVALEGKPEAGADDGRLAGRVVMKAAHAFNMPAMKVVAGESVAFRVRVADNYQPPGPAHVATSELYRISVVSKADLAKRIEGELIRLREEVKRSLEQQIRVRDASEDLVRELEGRPADADDLRRFQDLSARQGNLAGAVAQLQKQAEAIRDRINANKLEQQELAEHVASIGRALGDIAEGPMKQAQGALARAGNLTAGARDERKADGAERKSDGDSAEQQAAGGGQAGQTDERSQSNAPRQHGQEAVGHERKAVDALSNVLDRMNEYGSLADIVRELERLIEEQKAVEHRTMQLAQETLGRTVDKLTAEQSALLKEFERRQGGLAADTRRLVDNMKTVAGGLAASDPAGSRALGDAIEKGVTDDVIGKQAAAAASLAAGKTAAANGDQVAAHATLRAMLDVLKNRNERELAELIKRYAEAREAIRKLREQEQAHLKANQEAQGGNAGKDEFNQLARKQDQTARNAEQIAKELNDLRAQESAGAASRAAGSMDKAAKSLGQAGGKSAERQAGSEGQSGQSGQPASGNDADAKKAEEAQKEAIKFLDEADKELEKKEQEAQDRQDQDRREKLRDELAAIRDEQKAINLATEQVFGQAPGEADITRQHMAMLRGQSERQGKLHKQTAEVAAKVKAEATVMAWLLDKVVESMAESRKGLDGQLDLPSGLGRKGHNLAQVRIEQEFAARRLDEIIAALEDENKKKQDDQFAGGEGGGSGGGGSNQPLVPPAAELKLLKSMQLDVNARTRDSDIKFRGDGQVDDAEASQLKRLGDQQDQIRDLAEQMVERIRQSRDGS